MSCDKSTKTNFNSEWFEYANSYKSAHSGNCCGQTAEVVGCSGVTGPTGAEII